MLFVVVVGVVVFVVRGWLVIVVDFVVGSSGFCFAVVVRSDTSSLSFAFYRVFVLSSSF